MKAANFFIFSAVLASTLSATAARAESKHLTDLKECIDFAAKVTGKKYIYDRQVEGRTIGFTKNFEISAENADVALSNMLLVNELTRVPNGLPNTYYIIEAKSAIQSPVPVFEGSLSKEPELPNTFDIVTVKYTMLDRAVAESIQRFLTDLVPRYGRVSTYPNSSMLVMTDSAQNLRRVLDVVKSLDKPMSPEFKAELEKRKAEAAARAKQKS